MQNLYSKFIFIHILTEFFDSQSINKGKQYQLHFILKKLFIIAVVVIVYLQRKMNY